MQALRLAAAALHHERGCIAAGKAYFVTDGNPINNFEFMRPMIEVGGVRRAGVRAAAPCGRACAQ